jgi:LytS/YehU family sensor histidine kinase
MMRSVMSVKYGGRRGGPNARTWRRANRGKRRVKIGVRAALFFLVVTIATGIIGISLNLKLEKSERTRHAATEKHHGM